MASNNRAVATRQTTEVDDTRRKFDQLKSQLETRAADFRAALPSHIEPEKFQRVVITAVQQNPDLLAADRQTFLTSCMKAAQDALLPDGREAALVIYSTRKQVAGEWQTVKTVNYLPMAFGLRKKILQSGEVRDIFTNVVYRQEVEAGLFVYEEGTERTLRHRPLLDPEFDPTDDDIVAAYSVATFKDGSQSFEVMRRTDINKVRQMSQTGALGKKTRDGRDIPPKGPWVDWFAEQARKSVMRRHSKTLPMSGDLPGDTEPMSDAIAAHSTTAVLAYSSDEPAQLPSRSDIDVEQDNGRQNVIEHQQEVQQDDHDPETGEVYTEQEEVEQAEQVQPKQRPVLPMDVPTYDEAAAVIQKCASEDEVNTRLADLVRHFSGADAKNLRDEAAFRLSDLIEAKSKKRERA